MPETDVKNKQQKRIERLNQVKIKFYYINGSQEMVHWEGVKREL